MILSTGCVCFPPGHSLGPAKGGFWDRTNHELLGLSWEQRLARHASTFRGRGIAANAALQSHLDEKYWPNFPVRTVGRFGNSRLLPKAFWYTNKHGEVIVVTTVKDRKKYMRYIDDLPTEEKKKVPSGLGGKPYWLP